MAGIYIHIPFCKSRCIYCDFYSTTELAHRHDYINALCQEIEQRQNYLGTKIVNTIYIGGGTPSLLEISDLETLVNKLHQKFAFADNYEFTLEANPGDINTENAKKWIDLGINRLSIGVQSFNDGELQFMHRRHDCAKAIQAVEMVQDAGFDNVSIDIIYGLPNQTIDSLCESLQQAEKLNTQHISTYCLTYEGHTPLVRLLHQHEVVPASEDLQNLMFDTIVSTLAKHGYIHYEISNFAKQSFESRHNYSYWTGEPYLGLGAAAHSYDGYSRQYNESDLFKYIKGNYDIVTENLTLQDRYNEFIMLGLRTAKGINLQQLIEQFGAERADNCLRNAKLFINRNQLAVADQYLRINNDGWHLLDAITAELMITD